MLPARTTVAKRLGAFDLALVVLFLVGIYTGYNLQISARVPFPSALSGIAGMVLLWRRRDDIEAPAFVGLLLVVLCYLGSILSADNLAFLGKRFTGLIQLTYSLVIGYALFLTVLHAEREQIARVLLGFCLFMLIGCLLETYSGSMRALSDAVRLKLYSAGIYDADLRDLLLYGKIRPRLFTSEPSAVTFAFTLYSFAWFVVSRWRIRLYVYLALLAASLLAIPGPTSLLGLVMLGPYYVFLAGRTAEGGGLRVGRLVGATVFSLLLLVAAAVIGKTLFAERLHDIMVGDDPSFFYRVVGPALTGIDVLRHHPWAGAGLTSEQYIAREVINAFSTSPIFSSAWEIDRVADVLTNYFWLHWIYLGLVWGTVVVVAISVWLKLLKVPSLLFCWTIWAILGQASGAYVSPKTWTVMLLCAAAARMQLEPARRARLANWDMRLEPRLRLAADRRLPRPA